MVAAIAFVLLAVILVAADAYIEEIRSGRRDSHRRNR